jgi:UDPglucose 6-dehydrogenase
VKVAVVGCGYVGLVTGLGLTSVGHDVVGIEQDDARRARLAAGDAPFHEPGLEPLLRSGLESGRFEVSDDKGAAEDADVTMLAVQTPSGTDGAIDLSFLQAAAAELARVYAAAPRRRVVAVRSTVVPGTTEGVVAPAFDRPTTAVAANPEFLREGSAVSDFLHPDRVVVGCDEDWGREILADLFRPFGAPLVYTTPATAELAKYTSNAFLATLISFSNEIARVAEALPGVDVEDVLGILHRDRRLSPVVDGKEIKPDVLQYLKAGCGYGGSCLPKDLSALLASRAEHGEDHPLLEAVRTVNTGQAGHVVGMAEEAIGGLVGRRVAVLGLAFKGGTDDVRDSPGLRIANELVERGADVRAFDPLVRELPDSNASRFAVAKTLSEALAGAHACIVTTNAPEFGLLHEQLSQLAQPPILVDGRRTVQDGAPEYRAVGLGPKRVRRAD